MLNKAYPPWIGGIERHVADLGAALVERGWRVTALVANDARFETREWMHGVRVIRVPRWATLFSQPITTRYYRWLRNLNPDLVHVHAPYPLGWLAAKRVPPSVPILCTWHSDIIRQRWMMPLLRRFENSFLKRCSRVIVTSEQLLKRSRPLSRCQDRCAVIPLTLPNEDPSSMLYAHEAAKRIRASISGPIALFVGRLVGYKGLTYLIQAMRETQATLLIAGDGPDAKKLLNQSRQLGLHNQILFLGRVREEEKLALYQAADCFVLPSVTENEAFGYVLLEAMREGLPIITADLPTGVRFVNRHEESGLVVAPRDASALASAIQRIYSEEGLRDRLSLGARERFRREFDFGAAVSQVEALYREALKTTNREAR